MADGAPARAGIRARIEASRRRRVCAEAGLPQSNQRRRRSVLHPAMAEVYRAKVADLAGSLAAPDTRHEAADILRGLIEAIDCHRDDARRGYEIAARRSRGILRLAVERQKARRPFAGSGLFANGVGCGDRI